jgi:lipopolysaccharide biosynthesis glycosyltransferase
MSCDGNYAMQLATALRSIVENNRNAWPLQITIATHDLTEVARARIVASLPQGSSLIDWISVDLNLFEKFPTYMQTSRIIYARLLIPCWFSPTVGRVLYLDTDTLVLDDLTPLWKMDMQGAVIGAVLDGLDPQLKRAAAGVHDLPRVRDYFNSGVLLIDLDRWRAERVSERALKYLAEYPEPRFPDQDALNVVCDGRWKKLDQRWNFQDHHKTSFADMSSKQRPAIVHFVTGAKPWNPSSLNPNAALYDEFRSRTCFGRTAYEKLRDNAKVHWFRLTANLKKRVFASISESASTSSEHIVRRRKIK